MASLTLTIIMYYGITLTLTPAPTLTLTRILTDSASEEHDTVGVQEIVAEATLLMTLTLIIFLALTPILT